MKIDSTSYARLETLLLEFKAERNIKELQDYDTTQTRYLWEIYHACLDYLMVNQRVNDYLFIRGLYDRLNDNHIETALKRILITGKGLNHEQKRDRT